jgi:hypothetical protein
MQQNEEQNEDNRSFDSVITELKEKIGGDPEAALIITLNKKDDGVSMGGCVVGTRENLHTLLHFAEEKMIPSLKLQVAMQRIGFSPEMSQGDVPGRWPTDQRPDRQAPGLPAGWCLQLRRVRIRRLRPPGIPLHR